MTQEKSLEQQFLPSNRWKRVHITHLRPRLHRHSQFIYLQTQIKPDFTAAVSTLVQTQSFSEHEFEDDKALFSDCKYLINKIPISTSFVVYEVR